MITEAKKRADNKYRKEKVRQVVVRFGPPDADLLEYLEDQENMAGYIKQLIRVDMERGITMDDVKRYEFESANMGTVAVAITGEYRDGLMDVSVEVDGDLNKDFYEVDGGSAGDIVNWLVREGVEFESTRSMWFNLHYIASVMLDRDGTREQVLESAAEKSDEELAEWRETFIDA